jgi:hypothetical protein
MHFLTVGRCSITWLDAAESIEKTFFPGGNSVCAEGFFRVLYRKPAQIPPSPEPKFC